MERFVSFGFWLILVINELHIEVSKQLESLTFSLSILPLLLYLKTHLHGSNKCESHLSTIIWINVRIGHGPTIYQQEDLIYV
jgi:hypothetical protein